MSDTVTSKSKATQKTRMKTEGDSERTKNSKKRKAPVIVHQDDATDEQEENVLMSSTSLGHEASSAEQPPTKKRKSERSQDVKRSVEEQGKELETSKPSALFKPVRARKWTLSLAVPGSIIANVAKPDQKTLLAGRIARAAAVFSVDEIVVFDDDPSNIPNYVSERYRGKSRSKVETLEAIDENDQPWQNPDQFLFHVLSYAECPPYLRNDFENPQASLFGQHQNLRWAGQLPSLDMPHHLKSYEWCRYREGVTLGPAEVPLKTTLRSSKTSYSTEAGQKCTYVKCGLPYPVKIPIEIPPSVRVTLKFTDPTQPPSWPNLSHAQCDALDVEAVAPSAPREEEGYYWGYSVRRATSVSDIHISTEYPDGYDVSIGTSERGVALASILPKPNNEEAVDDEQTLPSDFKHLLVVFGGVAGLEPAVASDPEFNTRGLTKENAHEAFDAWVNILQGQGSRTIRTEEAIEFGLYGMKPYVDSMYGGTERI